MICGRFVVDHSFDHLQLWTKWKQCLQEHPKASFLDGEAPKSLVNQGKNRLRFLWEHDVKGSAAARGVRKQLSVVFPERDRARRRDVEPCHSDHFGSEKQFSEPFFFAYCTAIFLYTFALNSPTAEKEKL